jgi:hypothetical protein
MNRQQIALGLVLERAGIPASVTSFDDRLAVQKAVYLLQEGGVHLGYGYRWYLRGPYSPSLTEDLFTLADSPGTKEELADWQLSEPSAMRVSGFRKLLASTIAGNRARSLELLASVLFLVCTGQAKPDALGQITQMLRDKKKHFDEAQVAAAIGELRQYGFAM